MGEIEEKKPHKLARWVKVIVISGITFMIVFFVLSKYSHYYYYFNQGTPPRVLCGNDLKSLGLNIFRYQIDHNDQLPDANKWCDLLIENIEDLTKEDTTFRCPNDKTGPCSYALNPNCKSNSPSDVVLLFESRGGWNQSGGPELLNTDNHEGKGCNILFYDGHVECIDAKDLKNLKWK